ncbi:hypothetical protein C8Q79DRAFT_915364 [Trametes meyenii]|nr:hypothetical protein C8Q79DRAFT_915364 [Trametes meyenii]
MGKQEAIFSDPEKVWLNDQYQRGDVQAILAEGGDGILKRSAQLIFVDYQVAFCEPLPAETEEAYGRRLRNARAQRKQFITRRLAEGVEDVAMRMGRRTKDIRDWLKQKRREDKEKAGKAGGSQVQPVPVPPLTPRGRRRGKGALDVFAVSPLAREMIPHDICGIGPQRHALSQAFHTLDPSLKDNYAQQAREINAHEIAQSHQSAGSAEEVVRALKVAALGGWFNDIMRQMYLDTGWIGAGLVVGPDESGEMGMINIANEMDGKGRDYFQALADEVGLDRSHLMLWSLHWFQMTLKGESMLLC